MFKRITGILILLSFLLVKSTALFAVQQQDQNTVVISTQQDTDDKTNTPDAEKESKQLETVDEDFPDQPILYLASLTLSKKAGHLIVPEITAPYISLPYPPPNSCKL
ncbi:hypothetical protein [Pedobacter heparinus]|uniref:hypothetical protein n=1 Tax=Pedobacter heparinus TaxID=984 RepID=UPI00292F7DD2|nr:hypothetical protein [Pedobacter heparinus]